MEKEETEINLEFQDFGHSSSEFLQNEHSRHERDAYSSSFNNFIEDDQEKLLGDDDNAESSRQHYKNSFWTFEFYQQFFNVDTKQVSDRIMWSIIPKPGVNYLQSYIRPNPDLYGPFWVCVTLVMTTAIAGNISSYFQTPDTYRWRYDFHKVTLATSFIFTYAWLIPILLYGIFYWRGSRCNISLLELICLYGYSLSIFVPISLIWIIPVRWLQWCLGIVASVLSGSVLVLTLRPAFSHDSKKIALALASFIFILHAILALGFMLYFFYPTGSITPGPPSSLSPHNSTNIPKSYAALPDQNAKKDPQEKLNGASDVLKTKILRNDAKRSKDGLSSLHDSNANNKSSDNLKNNNLKSLSLIRDDSTDKIIKTNVDSTDKIVKTNVDSNDKKVKTNDAIKSEPKHRENFNNSEAVHLKDDSNSKIKIDNTKIPLKTPATVVSVKEINKNLTSTENSEHHKKDNTSQDKSDNVKSSIKKTEESKQI